MTDTKFAFLTGVTKFGKAMSQNPIPVIYQSRYLAIKDYDERFKMYELGFPNKEVENGFMNYLLPYYTPVKKTELLL